MEEAGAEEAGCGMVSLPLKRGSVRSNHETGLARPSFAASTVLKQTAATHASMPTQAGGLAGSRKAGLMAARFLGAYGSSRPRLSSSSIEVTARPQIASARCTLCSARMRAVTTPVESRFQTISMSGFSASNDFLKSLMFSTSRVE